jgi:hypothetical protein
LPDKNALHELEGLEPGRIISYIEMCQHERVSLQRGMNFRLRDGVSVILMSRRPGAPYADLVEEDGRVLTYEGHDVPAQIGGPSPKTVDQPLTSSNGRPTQNKLFYDAARSAAQSSQAPELVRVYEKIKQGIWTYNGTFHLTDAWIAHPGRRKVFKFRLVLTEEAPPQTPTDLLVDLQHNRLIPSEVKLEVWKRDLGRCVICGKQDNLHFDHDVPFSKGGSSLVVSNIRVLCARHNLAKHDRIE